MRSNACVAKWVLRRLPIGQVAARTPCHPLSTTGRTLSLLSASPNSKIGGRHGPLPKIFADASSEHGPVFTRVFRRLHATDVGEAHTGPSEASSPHSQTMDGKPHKPIAGLLPTAPRSPYPILRSSPTPARSSSASRPPFWDDFWLAADSGCCGLGLAGDCDMTVLRRQWNSLYPSDTQAAGMLLNSVAGGNWVRARKHAAHLVESALCARCGLTDETEAHRLWDCEHNSSLDLPACAPSTQSVTATLRPARHSGSGVWYQANSSISSRLPRIHRFLVERKQPHPTSSHPVKVSIC